MYGKMKYVSGKGMRQKNSPALKMAGYSFSDKVFLEKIVKEKNIVDIPCLTLSI